VLTDARSQTETIDGPLRCSLARSLAAASAAARCYANRISWTQHNAETPLDVASVRRVRPSSRRVIL